MLISLYGFIHYAILYSDSVFLVSIAFINLGTPTYLIGPVFLIYIRSVLSDDSRLRRTDSLHLVPMLIYFAGTFSYLIMPWSYKMEAANYITQGYNILKLLDDVTLFRVFSKQAVIVSRPVLVLGYIIWSGILIINYLKKEKGTLVFSGQRFMIKWLVALYGSFLIFIISHILHIVWSFAIKSFVLFYTSNIFLILSAAGLAGLLIAPFFFPEVLYGLPRLPELTGNQTHATHKASLRQAEKIKDETRFESEYLNLISEKINACMQEFQPYLQPGFNLTMLSKMLHVPGHHLAYYFREEKKQSFSDFRNELRVEYAKKLLAEKNTTSITLEAIGLLSGFSSRNTFIRVFKKFEGVAPQAYLSEIKKSAIA